MANIIFPNNQGVWVTPVQGSPFPRTGLAVNQALIDAAGESLGIVGRIIIEGGGSKTISSAGGIIYVSNFGAITFVDAGTNLRIGIQDVAATGIEDGSFDVYDDLVGGTDIITVNVPLAVTLSSGTKTISHGDEVAIVIEMTSLGGADSIRCDCQSGVGSVYPYRTQDAGSGPSKASTPLLSATLLFDDGSYGWIEGTVTAYNISTVSFAQNTAIADEYAVCFQSDIDGAVTTVGVSFTSVFSSAVFDIVIYSDPFGTPSVINTTSVNPNMLGSAAGNISVRLSSSVVIEKGNSYAISIKPTSNNSLTMVRHSFGSGNSFLRKSTMLGENWSQGTRLDNTGAFVQNTEFLPYISFSISEIETGGGGGTSVFS